MWPSRGCSGYTSAPLPTSPECPLSQQSQPESPFFAAWARFVIRARIPVILVSFAITAAFGWAAWQHLEVNNTTEYFAVGNSDVADRLEDFRDDFGRDDMYAVMVEGDVFSAEFLERLEGLLDDTGFLRPPEKRPAMVRSLRNLFARMSPSDQDLRTLHGIISALIRRSDPS